MLNNLLLFRYVHDRLRMSKGHGKEAEFRENRLLYRSLLKEKTGGYYAQPQHLAVVARRDF